MKTPACFNSERKYAVWLEAAEVTKWEEETIASHGHCLDCTPAYQAEMIRARKCEHPGVTFVKDQDGFICGRRPITIEKRGRPRKEAIAA